MGYETVLIVIGSGFNNRYVLADLHRFCLGDEVRACGRAEEIDVASLRNEAAVNECGCIACCIIADGEYDTAVCHALRVHGFGC